MKVPAEENNDTEKQADASGGCVPRRIAVCTDSGPGAADGAGQEGITELERVERHVPEDPEEQPAAWPALLPEPQPFVQEKFRKTELHDTPPTPDLADRVLRKNSLKYLASQVDSIRDRLDRCEFRLDRAISRLDRKIEELEDRWWYP